MNTSADARPEPACASDPDRWFDPGARTRALEACLSCPMRRDCAREALRTKANWGMWAGVWLDGTHGSAAGRLLAIAAEWPPRPRRAPAAPRAQPERVAPPLPHRRLLSARRVASVVAARASGHCEVMNDGCRFAASTVVSRIVGQAARDAASAAEVFYACSRCAGVATPADDDAVQSGRAVCTASQAQTMPFRWRATRWVLLGVNGELVELTAHLVAARSA